jgi:hypothetical protein
MRSDLIDLSMWRHAQTRKAILVSDDGVREHAVWLPLSQVEVVEEDETDLDIIVTLPEWLALEKGLI